MYLKQDISLRYLNKKLIAELENFITMLHDSALATDN